MISSISAPPPRMSLNFGKVIKKKSYRDCFEARTTVSRGGKPSVRVGIDLRRQPDKTNSKVVVRQLPLPGRHEVIRLHRRKDGSEYQTHKIFSPASTGSLLDGTLTIITEKRSAAGKLESVDYRWAAFNPNWLSIESPYRWDTKSVRAKIS